MLRVLLVDDDSSLSKGLSGIIEELEHAVKAVCSGEDAIALFEEGGKPFDLVLADVKLPGMSGIDLLKGVSQKSPETSVVLMTAYSDIDLAVLALETGAFGFLRKPFSRQELQVVFRNVQDRMRIQRHTFGLNQLLDGLDVINTANIAGGTSTNLDEILEVLLKTTLSSSGSILLLDDSGEKLGLAAHCGLSEEVIDNFSVDLNSSISGEVIKSGRAVVLGRPGRSPEEFQKKMKRPEVASSVVAPIVTKRRCFGVLNLNRNDDVAPFGDDEKRLVELAVHTLALSVENARLRQMQTNTCNQMQSIQRQLIQTEKLSSLGQLSAGIAHEINNPLTSVMGFSELLLRRSKDATQSSFLKKIISNADRIKKILLDLKDFYVPSRNRKSFVSINKIIENAIPIAKVHPEASVVTVKKQLKTGLPELYCDENQILQVLVNLLINAFQAMPDGGDVNVSCDSVDGDIVVEIEDTGVGIAPEDIDKIFDPFFTTKSDWKGTGLGLSVCYTIIGSHRGRIDVDSEPEKGTTFRVVLPLSAQEDMIQDVKSCPPRDTPMKVLVVDDESDCRELLGELLTGLGLEVEKAPNGRAAVERFHSGAKYDLVCLDYKMPEMDGAETYRAIRAIDEIVKVLVLTGSIGESAKMIVELGAQGFISKPFRVEEVETQIQKILFSEVRGPDVG